MHDGFLTSPYKSRKRLSYRATWPDGYGRMVETPSRRCDFTVQRRYLVSQTSSSPSFIGTNSNPTVIQAPDLYGERKDHSRCGQMVQNLISIACTTPADVLKVVRGVGTYVVGSMPPTKGGK